MRSSEFLKEEYDWTQDDGMDFVNPLPLIDDPDILDVMYEVDYELKLKDNSNHEYAKVLNVPISSIVCTEKYLDPRGLKDNDKKASSEMPIVYKQNNKYIAGDGNHRIVAAHLKGDKVIQCLVLDMDRILQ